jgi:putative Mg2+ transporter-C (MgtC) family protein
MELEIWILFRLFVAAVLSGLIGFEREKTVKRAGLRTHMLVAIGATMFVSTIDLALAEAAKIPPDSLASIVRFQVSTLDPVQAVAAGIGFLGAGTIFVSGHRGRVHGLTTAASIWTTAALGVIIGFDRFVLAVGGTVLILFILNVLVRLEPVIEELRDPNVPVDEHDPTTDPPKSADRQRTPDESDKTQE